MRIHIQYGVEIVCMNLQRNWRELHTWTFIKWVCFYRHKLLFIYYLFIYIYFIYLFTIYKVRHSKEKTKKNILKNNK